MVTDRLAEDAHHHPLKLVHPGAEVSPAHAQYNGHVNCRGHLHNGGQGDGYWHGFCLKSNYNNMSCNMQNRNVTATDREIYETWNQPLEVTLSQLNLLAMLTFHFFYQIL